MAVDFSKLVYDVTQNLYGRTIIVSPLKSQPGAPSYVARGIFDEEAMDVQTMDNAIYSETRIILDVREREFTVVPMQGDIIEIPAEGEIPSPGTFEVMDGDPNGGGETTLTLRKLVTAKP